MSTIIAAVLEQVESLGEQPPRPLAQFHGQESYAMFRAAGGVGYTRDQFFHFFGSGDAAAHDIEKWEATTEWHKWFGIDRAWVAIAEDVFGHQFCIRRDKRRDVVKVLSLWSGEFLTIADHFEAFLQSFVLASKSWERLKEIFRLAVSTGMKFDPFVHLSPLLPPLLGGKISQLADFELIDSIANVSILGQIFSQLKQVPPGAKVGSVEVNKAAGTVSITFI